jgi:hypothetical protein
MAMDNITGAIIEYFSLVIEKAKLEKGGPGSGHWGHAGRPGNRGGSVSGSVAVSIRTGRTARERQAAAKQTAQLRGFEGQATFGSIGTATGRAVHGGDILFNQEKFKALPAEARRHVVAHEIAHQTVEPYVLTNMEEWDRAESVLLVAESARGLKLFAGGNTSIGEAISDAVAVSITHDTFGNLSKDKMQEIYRWADTTSKGAGFSLNKLREDTDRILVQLESELD